MARRKIPTPDLEFSPQADAAFNRVTDLAHRLAAALLGEELSPEGRVQTHRAEAMVMGMGYFLFRIGPDDLHALFFAEGSLSQVEFVPLPAEADARIRPLFPDWRFLRMYPPEEYELP